MRYLVALLAAAVLAWQGMQAFARPPYTTDGWIWIAAAAVLAGVAFSSTEDLFPEPPARRLWERAAGRRAAAGGVLLLLGVAANAWADVTLYVKTYDLPATGVWVLSLILALLGIALWQAPTTRDAAAAAPRDRLRRLPYLEIALFLLLVGLAVFLRLYRLRSLPPGIFIDETNAALDALNIFEGRLDSPFGTGWFETPSMVAYYLLALFRLFGITWEALKAASLIPAIATVIVLYPLARTLFGPPVALASTFFLAVSRWHLTMSRWGWNEVAPPLFQLAGLYFLVRGARSRRGLDFALSGLLLGVGMYTYLASRLVVAAVALYVVYRVLVERGFLRRAWAGLALMGLLYAMTFVPLAGTYVKNPFTFLNRSQQVSILNDMRQAGSSAPLFENVRRHLEMFTVQGDANPRHNLPGAPMLDPLTGALFLIGFGYGLWHLRDHRRGLLLIWVPVTLAGGVLSALGEGPQAYRTLTVVPAVSLLAGDTLVRAWSVLALGLRRTRGTPGAEKRRAWWATPQAFATLPLPIALLVVAGALNVSTYFGAQAESEAVWQAFSPVETAVAREVAAKQFTYSLYLAPRLYNFSPVRFLTYRSPYDGGGGLRETPYRQAQPVDDLPLPDLAGRDALFLLDTHYAGLTELFTHYYPGATSHMVSGPQGEPLYFSVTIPGSEIVALHGLHGTYGSVTRRDARVDFRWPQDWPAGVGLAPVTWSGSLRVPASGEINLRTTGGSALLVDGEPWQGARFLGKGLHDLRLVTEDPAAAGGTTLYWQLAGEAEETLPAEALFATSAPRQGLLARYYANEDWTGAPVFEQVAPLVLYAWRENEPWFGPFSDTFTGDIDATQDGSYLFSVNGDDGVRLWLDDRLVGESVIPDAANVLDVSVTWTAGRHAIRVDHFQRGGGKALELWWQPPGEPRQVVPPHVLAPS